MKKIFSIAAAFVFAAVMFIGCDSDSSDNSGLALALLMMQPSSSMSGSAADVESSSQAVGAASAASGVASSTAMMGAMLGGSPNIVADGTDALVKDSIQKSIVSSVLVKKSIAIGDRKAATTEVDLTLDSALTSMPGATITPNIHVAGTMTSTAISETKTLIILDLSMTGSITTVFTACTIHVFDVYNFILNNEFGFVEVTLNGTTNTTNINSTFYMRATMNVVSIDTETGDITMQGTTYGSSKGTSDTDATDLGIAVGGGSSSPHTFDVTTTDTSSSTSTATTVMNGMSVVSQTINSFSGSMVLSAEGTADGNPVSYTIVLKNEQMQEYQATLGTPGE